MRLLRLATLIALLLPLGSFVPPAQADKVKYKSRDDQPQAQQRQGQDGGARYKQPPPPPPDNRPPSREHPIKPPPDPRQPDTPAPQPPPPIFIPREYCPPPMPIWEDRCDPWLPPIGWEPVPLPAPVPTFRGAVERRLRYMESEGFEGQVVVGWDGRVEFDNTNARRNRIPDGGRYDIGSVARAFTSWAVYRLVDSGKLRLSTTLGELFPGAPADKRGITIEQLLGQTSGLGNTYAADGEADRDVAVSNLLAQQLSFRPGAMFRDSDDSYVLLAAVIEVASGMAYESFMFESDIVGADMRNTALVGQGDWGQRGSGGIVSSAHDLFAWATRFMDDPAVDEIIDPRQGAASGQGVGYGWYWVGTESGERILRTSGGGGFNHNVTVSVFPSGGVLVVTSHRFHGSVPWSERATNTLEPLLLDSDPATITTSFAR